MKLCGATGNTVYEFSSNSSLAIFHTRRNLRENYILVSKVCVAFPYLSK